MSDVPANGGLLRQLAGRWQVPLLLVSLAALAGGVWRLRPAPRPPAFEPLFAHASSLHRGGLYPEANTYINRLLAAPDRTAEQARKLYGLLARVVFDHERGNVVHAPANAERIIKYSDQSLSKGDSHDVATLRMRASAWEWLLKPAEATAEYEAIIRKNVPDTWALRRRVLDLHRSMGKLSEEQLRAECAAFVSDPAAGDKLALWAAEEIVDSLARQRKFDEAERFVAAHADRFQHSSEKGAYDYLQGLIWFHGGRRADAERLMRAVRDRLGPADPAFSRAGVLLGKILLDEQAPEYALAFFDDVIAQTPSGPHRWVALVGRAECLDVLERLDEALEAYNEAAAQASESPYESLIEMSPSGGGNAASLEGMLPQWRSSKAAAYLRIFKRRAELTMRLGKEAMVAAAQDTVTDSSAFDRARQRLVRAGEHYLGLAGMVMLDDAGSAAATLEAADAFDLAGERERLIEVLEGFVRGYTGNTMVPEALRRAGRAYQSLGQYDQAIERYQQNLIRFPRTPAAIGSLVPLAECFLARGQTDKAEATLLRLVDRVPSDPLGLITPDADQYRDALFGLADLYMRSGQPEKAIARYEEAIERYRDDPRVDRAIFMLATAYRSSAEHIRWEFKDSASLPYMAEFSKAHRERLERARRLFVQVIERYRDRPAVRLSEQDRLFVRLSYLYAADSVFEGAELAALPTSQPAAEALELYERAAWACAQEPVAMAAYVQIINCHVRLGRMEKARMALQRARWALRNIPEEAFPRPPQEDRAFWEEYLTWLETTPTFAATQPAAG